MPDQRVEILHYIETSKAGRAPSTLSSAEERILEAVNRKVAAVESLEKVIDFLFDSMRAICPCDRIGVAFLEDDDQRVTSQYVRALYRETVLKRGYSEDLRDSSLERLLRDSRIRIINDLAAYWETHPASVSSKLLVREGVRSSMTCPLTVDGRRVGFLFRSSRKPFAYSEHEVQLHLAIAERLSQAVEKAYRIEQLTAANRAYGEMLGFVSHELKSPIASMAGDANLLVGGYLGPLEEKQREYIDKIIGKSRYLLNLIGDYLDLARIEAGRLELELQPAVDFVAEIVEPSLDILQSQIDVQKQRLVRSLPSGKVEIECDPNLLKIVLVNLIGNAVKYGSEGGEIRLGVEQTPKELIVSVWNEGPGFPSEQRSQLFRKFSRLKTPELSKRKGSGVGLYTTWKIIQLHGGKIWANSEEGCWAEFILRIPQPVKSE